MSNEIINDDEIMNITAEQVKLLYIKNVLKEIIEEAKNGKIFHEARLNHEEIMFLENKGFKVEFLCTAYDYNDNRDHWYTIQW